MQRRKVDLPPPDGPITQTHSPLSTWASIPLRTSSSPKYLWRFCTSITSTHPPFQSIQPGGEHGSHQEIDIRRAEQGDDIVVGHAAHRLGAFGQVGDADIARDRGFLEQDDEFVSEGRQHVLTAWG